MREIEIKARLVNKPEVLAKLKEMGVSLSDPIKQHDIVYGRPGMTGGEMDAIWLRVRTENDVKTIFTLKKPVVGQLDSLEHELEIGDGEEMKAIMRLLGFELFSDVTKHRQKGKFGEIEICVDEVDGLGSFIEAEQLTDENADHNVVRQELWQLFENLTIKKDDEISKGYDILERELRGL
jgi:adenylate cyclase class 2